MSKNSHSYLKFIKHANFKWYALLITSFVIPFFYASFLPLLLLIGLIVGDMTFKKNYGGNSNPNPAFLSFIFPFTYGFYVPICIILVRYLAIDGFMTLHNWYPITLFALITCIGSGLFYFFILVSIFTRKIDHYALLARLLSLVVCILVWIGIFFVVRTFYQDIRDGLSNYKGSCKISYSQGGRYGPSYYSIKFADNNWYIINNETADSLYNKNGTCNYSVNVFYLQHAGIAFVTESL